MVSTEHEQFEAENPSHPMAKIIGLTGGIASGKSTISTLFREHGVIIIDADIISREVVQPGTPALKEISDTFGQDMILSNGELNREKLGTVIFNDTQARERLNAIVHPHVARRFLEQIQTSSQNAERWVIYDAALIVENNLQSGFDGLIVVRCEPDVQKARLMRRNALTEVEAQHRIDSQFPLEKKVEVADWIIDNSGTLPQSKKLVSDLFETLCLEFGRPNDRKNDD